MSGVPLRPDGNVVIAAVAEAGRLLDRRADLSASQSSARARKIAMAALQEVFTGLSWKELGAMVGEDLENPTASIAMARATSWWRDSDVEEVVGEILSHYIGDRA